MMVTNDLKENIDNLYPQNLNHLMKFKTSCDTHSKTYIAVLQFISKKENVIATVLQNTSKKKHFIVHIIKDNVLLTNAVLTDQNPFAIRVQRHCWWDWFEKATS